MWADEKSQQRRMKLFILHGTGFFKAFPLSEEDRDLVDHRMGGER